MWFSGVRALPRGDASGSRRPGVVRRLILAVGHFKCHVGIIGCRRGGGAPSPLRQGGALQREHALLRDLEAVLMRRRRRHGAVRRQRRREVPPDGPLVRDSLVPCSGEDKRDREARDDWAWTRLVHPVRSGGTL